MKVERDLGAGERAAEFVHYPHDPNDSGSLSDSMVFELFEDRAGVLWVGTGKGLERFDRSTGRFELIGARGNVRLQPDGVVAVTEDAAGDLWFAHQNIGLGRLAPD